MCSDLSVLMVQCIRVYLEHLIQSISSVSVCVKASAGIVAVPSPIPRVCVCVCVCLCAAWEQPENGGGEESRGRIQSCSRLSFH